MDDEVRNVHIRFYHFTDIKLSASFGDSVKKSYLFTFPTLQTLRGLRFKLELVGDSRG